ncbi:hypothetical protein CTI12_AA615340 [Artemisia annua]|uniref:Uncharacterized protein n=1 Tax=Artemisia annua TaxID=35608 RepID=A0A2U1KDT5_ARTAN|nr:hypothetical protein CTI12_AA615340 [Artemisia annua]
MEITGPSPIVPFLIVNALALIIFSPMVQNLVMIPVLLILVIYFFSSFFSSQDTSAVSYQDQSGSSHEAKCVCYAICDHELKFNSFKAQLYLHSLCSAVKDSTSFRLYLSILFIILSVEKINNQLNTHSYIHCVRFMSMHICWLDISKRILYWCSTRHTKMRVGGPSPLVPSLFVCVLGLVIFSSALENLWETISSFVIGEEVMLFLPILLLLLILISTFLPTRYNSYSYESSSSSHFDSEGFGFGFGSLLLALLFIILCHVFA